MSVPPRRPRPTHLVLGCLLLTAGCASTRYELSPPPATVTRVAPVAPEPAPESAPDAPPPPSALPGGAERDPFVPPQDEDGRFPTSTGFTYRKQDVESWPRQRVWLFLGGTQNTDGSAFTTGLRYGYYLYGNVGFGALVDYSDRDDTTWVLAAAVYARPTRHFQITVAPGFQFTDSDSDPMIRTGFEYEFELSELLAIVPNLSFDIVSNQPNATNLGVSLQASF